MQETEVKVCVVNPASPGIAALIQELDAYLWALYPDEPYHYLTIADLQQPQVTFVAAYRGPIPIGCGALVLQQSGAEIYGEIKRIFVSPPHRGRRIGRQLMALLEDQARLQGLCLLKLETGIYQPESLRLYEAMGYQTCRAFGHYIDHPLSVFMEKQIGLG